MVTQLLFDGYQTISTKAMTHQRRTGGKLGQQVTFTDEMILTMKKETFMAHPDNKQKFIDMLSQYLNMYNCTTYHADAEADVLIIQMAIS